MRGVSFSSIASRLPGVAIAAVIGLPMAWAAVTIAGDPHTVFAGLWDARLLGLFARTSGYALAASLLAAAMAVPVGLALGRGRSTAARALWFVVPLPLLLPTMVLGYGWNEALRMAGIHPVPQGFADVFRCIAVLATWCWPVPAVLVAVALRRVDESLLEQAELDGALGRFVARRALPPLLAGVAIATALCLQEFAIFEPTGISVMATEVRMIFETGMLSSADNPIAALQGGVGAATSADLPRRAALALAAGLPVLLLTAALALLAMALLRRRNAADEAIEIDRPRVRTVATSRGPTRIVAAGWGVVAFTIIAPLIWMVVALPLGFSPGAMVAEFAPQLLSSVLLSIATAALCGLIALAAAVRRPRWLLPLGVAGFLLGGQFTAIAILRLCGSAWATRYLLDTNIAAAWAYVSRFAWIALAAGAGLHGGAWQRYRDMAGVDGATAPQAAWHVIFKMAWPTLLAAALLVATLTLAEVPATALLTPPSMVPMLLTWVHQQRYGPMLEASLLLAMVVLTLGWTAVALIAIARRSGSLSRYAGRGLG